MLRFESLIFWPCHFVIEVAKYVFATATGIALFHYLGIWLFGFHLLAGLGEIRNLYLSSSVLFYWTLVAGLSVTIACWSVGGAALYLLYLVWRWGRLYTAAEK